MADIRRDRQFCIVASRTLGPSSDRAEVGVLLTTTRVFNMHT
jgi:hypothetical protein